MATKVSITNLALTKIGVDNISRMDESTNQARRANAIFDLTLDSMLVIHPWNFAIERQTLARSSTTPTYEYSYKFALPTDPYCLKVLKVVDSEDDEIEDYRIEGRYVFTDETAISIKYIKRITDMSTLSPAFIEMFATYIARLLAPQLAGDVNMMAILSQEFNFWRKTAKLQDATEGAPRPRAVGDWINVRS